MKVTKINMVGVATALFMSGLCTQPLLAAEPASPEQDRAHLLGDWGGARSQLAEHGIIFDFQATQFYQASVSCCA